MFGSDISDTQNMGIIPRVANDIFNRKNSNIQVKIKMVEIYKENLIDLMVPKPID